MRHSFPVFVIIIASCFRVHGQPGFGPEIGIGMSSMHFAPAPGFTSSSVSPIFSWRAGGIADLGLSKNIYFQAGLFLSQKGQSRDFSFYSSNSLNEAVNQTLTIYYGEVPLSVVYKTGMQGKGRFFFGIGATPSYIFGGKNKFQAHGDDTGMAFTVNNNSKIVAGNPVALFDLGLNLSGGFEAATGLYFRAYYTVGVSDIGLGGEIDKNRMWGIGAGYILGKGRNINKEKDDLIDKSTD